MRTPGWAVLVAASAAAAVFVEWHTDEVTVVLAVMLVLAVPIGAARPRLAAAGGAVLGFSILTAHAVTEAAETMRPAYQHDAIRLGDWAAMAIAGLVVTFVAWGAGVARSRLARASYFAR